MYNILILESSAGLNVLSIYSKISSTPICAELPTDQTEEKRRPFDNADSIMKSAVPPELEMKSAPSGWNSGIGWLKTPWKFTFISPMQFGPMSDAPASLAAASIRASNAAPSGVSSPKPADMTMKARTPFFFARISTASGQAVLGMERIAISVSGISSTEG